LTLLVASPFQARAEQHRATRLGNPATRFAPPLYTTADLRARFNDPKLHGDFIEILRQWGWEGNTDDFFAAGRTNEIVECEIPVGDTLPFMSSRENRKPICLRNVTWAGREPIRAFAFVFNSNGRVYRCVVPRPCSNFYIIDLGPEPKMALAIDCNVPSKVVLGRPVTITLTLTNTGDLLIDKTTVTLPIPENSAITGVTDGGKANNLTNGVVTWDILNLPIKSSKQVCAQFNTVQSAKLAWRSTAFNSRAPAATSDCQTEVHGIPAILLEKSDDPDPVSIGDTTTYTAKVTNQGTTDDDNVQVTVIVDEQLIPISCDQGGTINGQTVTFPIIPKLAPKEVVTYKVIAKGVKPGDARTRFELSADMIKQPVFGEESTTVY